MAALRPLLPIALAALLLAGCASQAPPDPTDPAPPSPEEVQAASYEEIKALMAGVPCDNVPVGPTTSANLKLLGKVKFNGSAGTKSIDARGGFMVAARKPMPVINMTNALAPQVMGEFEEVFSTSDVKISPDNMTALIGGLSKIQMIDIRDPEEPTLVGEWSLSEAGRPPGAMRNVHMFYTALIKGQQWVFLAPNSNDGAWILKLTGPPEARKLEYVTQTLPIEGGPLGPHDIWVGYDEPTKRWLLYSADGFHGWAAFDVSDPAKPTFAGGIIKPEGGYTHTIQAAHIDGKRIVVTAQEVGANLLEVYDATILQAPVLLATWQASVEGTPQPAAPQHEFNIVAGRLYLGHYGNGFYVFDLTKVKTPVAGTTNLRPVAHYAVGSGGPAGPTDFSQIWSVDVYNGVIYVSSMKDGIHVVGYGCLTPGDKGLNGTG